LTASCGTSPWVTKVTSLCLLALQACQTLIKFDGFNAHSFFNDNVKSVSATDGQTVHFELKQSNSRFHTTFLDRWGCTWVMPKHIF
jgi:peptide/nickel transport system substrate-binding protein